jgi:hypothetical protein
MGILNVFSSLAFDITHCALRNVLRNRLHILNVFSGFRLNVAHCALRNILRHSWASSMPSVSSISISRIAHCAKPCVKPREPLAISHIVRCATHCAIPNIFNGLALDFEHCTLFNALFNANIRQPEHLELAELVAELVVELVAEHRDFGIVCSPEKASK